MPPKRFVGKRAAPSSHGDPDAKRAKGAAAVPTKQLAVSIIPEAEIPLSAKVKRTGVKSKLAYINKRCDERNGLSVQACLYLKFRNAHGDTTKYNFGDLRYDIQQGRLEIVGSSDTKHDSMPIAGATEEPPIAVVDVACLGAENVQDQHVCCTASADNVVAVVHGLPNDDDGVASTRGPKRFRNAEATLLTLVAMLHGWLSQHRDLTGYPTYACIAVVALIVVGVVMVALGTSGADVERLVAFYKYLFAVYMLVDIQILVAENGGLCIECAALAVKLDMLH